jgi:hypothetical protein
MSNMLALTRLAQQVWQFGDIHRNPPHLAGQSGADVGPPYLLDILVYIKKISSRAIIIKITHTTDPTIKRDISAKGLAP